MSVIAKTYLGDGAYVEVGSYAGEIKLTTSDGVSDTNTIYLDSDMTNMLLAFIAETRRVK